jgi:hypothetical protein
MIRIEVKTTEVQTRNGTSQRTGQPWTIRSQDAWAYTLDSNGKPRPYPERISLQLDDNQLPFPLGNYDLSPASIYVGEFGRLMMGRPQLTPVAAVKAA